MLAVLAACGGAANRSTGIRAPVPVTTTTRAARAARRIGPRCPAAVPTGRVEAKPLSAEPSGVYLCPYSNARPITAPIGVRLTEREAASLARQFLARPVDDALGARCATHAAEVLARFTTANGMVVDVPMEGNGCPQPLVYVDGHAHVLDGNLHDYLVATAGEFGLRAGLGLHGAVTPDIVGSSFVQARTILHNVGFDFISIEQEPDGTVAPGTILLQSPPAGEPGIQSDLRFVDVTVAAPAAAAPCLAANLIVYYDGSVGAGGSQVGRFVVRNVGATACALRPPIVLVGFGAAGHVDTNVLRYTVAPTTVLSPRAPVVRPQTNAPAGVFLGGVPVVGDPRDDDTPDGECHRIVTPVTWQLTIGGATRDVPNRVPTDSGRTGLPTCRGRISGMAVTASSAP